MCFDLSHFALRTEIIIAEAVAYFFDKSEILGYNEYIKMKERKCPMNAKKDNQYYGKYFEYLVACILNKELPCLSAEQWGVAGEDGLAIEKEAHEVATFLGPHR